MILPSQEDLAALEGRIRHALASGDEGKLRILGYGEISTVVALTTSSGSFACKRMPPLPSRARFESYRELFEAYVARLEDSGTRVIETTMVGVDGDSGVSAYCVQPLLPADTLLTRWLGQASESDAVDRFEQVLERARSSVSTEVGLDGQLSNWAIVDGTLRYLDLTTPMLRSSSGQELLDVEVHLASLPFVMRGVVRRWVVKDILDKYYQPRAIVLDALANLHKERLTRLLPRFVAAANRHFDPPFEEAEVARYYRSDARLWALLLRARRIDRLWQRHVRRRPYPFLLPGPIQR